MHIKSIKIKYQSHLLLNLKFDPLKKLIGLNHFHYVQNFRNDNLLGLYTPSEKKCSFPYPSLPSATGEKIIQLQIAAITSARFLTSFGLSKPVFHSSTLFLLHRL